MASWETETTQSGFDASSQMSNVISGRGRTVDFSDNSTFEQFGEGYTSGTVLNGAGEHEVSTSKWYNPFTWGDTATVGYDIVGIKATEVPKMREAINDYVNNITTYLEGAIDTSKSQAKTAFRGSEAEEAVKAYLDKVKDYINNLVSHLLAFSDKLADIGNAWIDAQQNIASNVNASKGAFSEGSKYTETVQYRG